MLELNDNNKASISVQKFFIQFSILCIKNQNLAKKQIYITRKKLIG